MYLQYIAAPAFECRTLCSLAFCGGFCLRSAHLHVSFGVLSFLFILVCNPTSSSSTVAAAKLSDDGLEHVIAATMGVEPPCNVDGAASGLDSTCLDCN